MDEVINQIQEKANLFHQLESDEAFLFTFINTHKESFDTIKARYSIDGVKRIKTVNLLRFLIADQGSKGESIDSEMIEEIKKAIEQKDVSKFYELNESAKQKLQKLPKKKKSPFVIWQQPYSVLFPFLYDESEQTETRSFVESLAGTVIEYHDLQNVKIHTVTFSGPRHTGDDRVWGAIIPEDSSGVQDSFQIFFSVDKDGILAGIHKGHRVKKNFSDIHNRYEKWEDFMQDSTHFVQEWKDLNESLNNEDSYKKTEFLKVIKSLSSTSILQYYNFLDRLIHEVDMKNTEALVFSTANGQLSFQYGKRYCLNLKKDEFSVITPQEYKRNYRKTNFTGDSEPNFYEGIEVEAIDSFYEAFEEAVTYERERDNHTLVKTYDNPFFRETVFNINFRKEIIGMENTRYWALGFNSNHEKLEEFKREQFWDALYHDRNSPELAAKKAYRLFDQIKKGDFILIKGYGGSHDLTVHCVGRVESIEKDINKISFKKVEVPFYRGKAPRGANAGNWHNTILEVRREEDLESLFGKARLDENTSAKNMTKKTQESAVNKIFFGPPGTGKTYKLEKEYIPNYTSKETKLTKEEFFKEVVEGCTWWEVIALAILELGKTKVGIIYNNRWVKTKAELTGSNSVRQTLWAQLQSHTVSECEHVNVAKRMAPQIFSKTESSEWEILEDLLEDLAPEVYEKKKKVDDFRPEQDKEIRRYAFVTFHQSFSYEDFIEGIKPVFPKNEESVADLSYTIESGVFKRICTRAKNDPENRYAVFIDEINRGNVSSIFGELISLIEPDKRIGAKNQIYVDLPYSKTQFGVPNNVDIYGTMNTADRSIEALDTALRRRFEFEEVIPNPNVLREVGESGKVNAIVDGIDLTILLTKINLRIEKLIDKDHKIGHSYFIDVYNRDTLIKCFKDKVIPLLEEYFYGDYGKIGLVLGKSFVKKEDASTFSFSEFEEYDQDITNDLKERDVYHMKTSDEWDFNQI